VFSDRLHPILNPKNVRYMITNQSPEPTDFQKCDGAVKELLSGSRDDVIAIEYF
jgi:hypothetical protein